MKKILLLFILAVSLVLSSCGQRRYTVTLNIDGQAVTEVKVSHTSELPKPDAREGMAFAGWFYDADFTELVFNSEIDGPTSLYARWLPIESVGYAVVLDFGNGEHSVVYTNDRISEPKEPVKEGYAFLGWYYEGTDEPCDFSRQITEYTVICARFEEIGEDTVRRVTFKSNNGEEDKELTVDYGSKLAEPTEPIKSGFSFCGWYSDIAFTELFDFDSPITRDTVLYAGWCADGTETVNRLYSEVLLSSVKVSVLRYNKSYFGNVTGSHNSLGSGVIYKETDQFYYLLTNSHVVRQEEEYEFTEYEVYDAYGTKHGATVVADNPAYDLAVLRIDKVKELCTVSIDASGQSAGDITYCVGNPCGLVNSVSMGLFKGNKLLNGTNESVAPEFEVGAHSAPTEHGSSGGGVYSAELKLVGISFAVSTDSDGAFLLSYYIPSQRVIEFLNENNIA